MKLGKVIGKLWCTRKDQALQGVKLYVMQPLDKNLQPLGRPLIAADGVGASEGEIVYWVSAREAVYAVDGRHIPSDCSIVGILDDIYVAPEQGEK